MRPQANDECPYQQTEKKKTQRDKKERWNAATNQGTSEPPESGRGDKDSPLEPSEGAQLY